MSPFECWLGSGQKMKLRPYYASALPVCSVKSFPVQMGSVIFSSPDSCLIWVQIITKMVQGLELLSGSLWVLLNLGLNEQRRATFIIYIYRQSDLTVHITHHSQKQNKIPVRQHSMGEQQEKQTQYSICCVAQMGLYKVLWPASLFTWPL